MAAVWIKPSARNVVGTTRLRTEGVTGRRPTFQQAGGREGPGCGPRLWWLCRWAVPAGPRPATRPAQKIVGHQGAGSHDIAADSAATAPGRRCVTRPAAASEPSRVPPR